MALSGSVTRMNSLLVLAICCIWHVCQCSPQPEFKLVKESTLKISPGQVTGRVWSLDEKEAKIFKGIPYAEPPIGSNRFKKPVEPLAWTEPRTAFKCGPSCIQFMDYHRMDKFSEKSMAVQSEDCLYLNVFAPHNETATDKYPVMLWIHGGSFLAGSGDTGMATHSILRNFVFRNIILVTINYRLGPHGFLASEDSDHKGNFGLWDMVMALNWIHRNIYVFGGDPEAVTLIGESAGGAAVSILALSPVVKDLVNHAIIMSGSAVSPWAIEKVKGDWNLRTVMDYLSCRKQFDWKQLQEIFSEKELQGQEENPCPFVEEALECEADLPIQEAWQCFRENAIFSSVKIRKALTMELGISKAVVDGELIPEPLPGFLDNNIHIPIMTGIAELEWGHKKDKYYGYEGSVNLTEESRKEKVYSIVDGSFRQNLPVSTPNETFYLLGNTTYYNYITRAPDQRHNSDVKKFAHKLRQIESDLEFVAPCAKEAIEYSRAGQPVYLYSFEKVPNNEVLEEEDTDDLFDLPVKKTTKRYYNYAYHGLDHAYLFSEGYSSNQYFQYDNDDRTLSNQISSLIANFVKHGNPTPEPIGGIQWPRYNPENPTYLRIDSPMHVENADFHHQGSSFWNEHIPFLTHFAEKAQSMNGGHRLSADEEFQLAAYRRAWWALWVLVALIAFALWTAVVCIVARRCINKRSGKSYKSVVITDT